MEALKVIRPQWSAPDHIQAFTTTRQGGISQGAYAGFNLGDRAGDVPEVVAENRRILRNSCNLPGEPAWLWQVHSAKVVDAKRASETSEADASVASSSGVVSVVLTADCLPVLLCDQAGTVVAAVHCGWRGIAAGILPATVARMGVEPDSLMAWMGPAIGPRAFEVGAEVRNEFAKRNAEHSAAFTPGKPGKFLADIYALARRELAECGVVRVSGAEYCTVSDPDQFYSYRRDAVTGRMASLIWISQRP